MAMNANVYAKMPYDPQRDLTPIIHTVMFPYAVVINAALPIRTVSELVSYAKEHPGKLAYGSAGSGSGHHMAAELFKSQTGTDMMHVPYKGMGPMVIDLVAGHVQVTISDLTTLMPHVKTGKLRALAVCSSTRIAEYPDLPTVAQAAGAPGYEAGGWMGIAGPAGMPPAIVKRLNEAFNKAQQAPEVRAKLIAANMIPVGGNEEDFGRYTRNEKAKWAKVAKAINLMPE
jgi:tripartite-type tricarboxylate transporter receptor subunit TctC